MGLKTLPRTAMLIDASYESAMQMREILAKIGFKMEEWVTSGVGWGEIWQSSRPTLVIVDLMLPRRDGLYCIAKIRELHSEARIIFTHSFSGQMANEVELKAISYGAAIVAQKPIVASRLQSAIQRLMASQLQMPTKIDSPSES